MFRKKFGSFASTRLIVTADDFGLAETVNEGVEQAHRSGVLSAASLMVSAPAAADAVRRARNMPELRVGLHLVLADGRPTLPPQAIPDLVNAKGRFDDNMFRAGTGFFFSRRVRAQLAAEIRAQFEAFEATGLTLDHVNAHKHFHLHPTVFGLMLAIGREHGAGAIRLPREPLISGLRIDRGRWPSRLGWSIFLAPWVWLMKARVRRAGLLCNDAVLGLGASGGMDEAMMLRILDHLPKGIVEIYLHPATRSGREVSAAMAAYRHSSELEALMSTRVRARLIELGLTPGGFADIADDARLRSS